MNEDDLRPPVGTQHVRIGWETPDGLNEDMIRAVVDRFYADIRRDPLVGPIFSRIIPAEAWAHHLDIIADFWSSMLLGTGRYFGRPLPKHIAIEDLEDVHFMRWLALFKRTVEEICPPDIATLFVERSERIGNSFRMNIAMRRGHDIRTMEPLPRETPFWSPPD